MPEKVVELPDGRVVSFPDGMSDADISAAIESDMASQPTPSAEPKGFLEAFGGRFVDAAKGIGALIGSSGNPQKQMEMVKGMIQPNIEQFQKMSGAMAAGRPDIAGGRFLAGMIPGVGPTIANAVEQVSQGNYQQPAGELMADLVMAIVPSVLKKIRVNPSNLLNPVEQKAVEFAVQKGIPVNLATGTQNPLYQGAQAAVEKLPFSAKVGKQFQLAQNKALQEEAKALAGRSAAPAVDLYEAGGKLYKSVEHKLTKEVIPKQQAAYQMVDQIANRPQNIKTIQTGTQTSPIAGPDGKPITTPVMEQIAGPVDIRGVKMRLKPLYDKLIESMPEAQRQMSPGLSVLKQVMDSPNVVPLSKANADYSAILTISRRDHPAVVKASQGIGIAVGKPYRETIDAAATRMDPKALEALNAGRKATIDKFRLDELRKHLGEEPGKIADKLIQPGDKSFAALSEIAQEFPDQVQTMGRSYLERIFNQAANEGGFKGARALADWNRLGPRTKNLLYSADPALQADIGNFFQIAKMVGIDPNPSQSGKVASLIAAGAMVARHPVNGSMYVLSGGAISRLMYGKGGAKLLSNSLRLPAASPAGRDAMNRLWVAYSFSTQDEAVEQQANQ